MPKEEQQSKSSQPGFVVDVGSVSIPRNRCVASFAKVEISKSLA